MKKTLLIGVFMMSFGGSKTFGQDIKQSQVPPSILNSFQQGFPKTSDVEWEIDGEMYKVEFETGLIKSDQRAWYDKTGKLVKHKEEISKNNLPSKVLSKINSDFGGYKVDDVKKITEESKVTYTVELKSFTEEWKVAIDENGNILSKVAD